MDKSHSLALNSRLDGHKRALLTCGPMDHGLITDIAVCIIAAWVVAVICQVGKQPLLIAYLGAGFAIGPHCIKWVTNSDSIRTIADIGLILLLFMIGLEMDLKKMLGSGKVIARLGTRTWERVLPYARLTSPSYTSLSALRIGWL